VSRGWITAAIFFFLGSCCLGGLVMAGLKGPEGLGSEEWQQTFGPRDAGAETSPDAG
jgi:hypothetical protein